MHLCWISVFSIFCLTRVLFGHKSAEAHPEQRFVTPQQNQKLRAARDLLLPRLMSGELVV